MHSLNPKYLNSIKFTTQQASSMSRIAEFRGQQELFTRQTPEVLESLRKAAVVESTESSNRIEGVTAPHERIEDLVLKSSAPQNRSEQEIAGYRDALNLLHESAPHMEFSTNVILQFHSMIYRHMPEEGGHWKKVDNKIVEKNPDGTIQRVRFTPVSAFKTPQAMDQLAEFYREAALVESKEPLLLIPLAVFDFLCIHPFRDGNGRVARLLTLMLLYHADIQVGRYISLERIFEESRETYYETLEASSHGWHAGKHDVAPWLDYFWGVLIRAYREFQERVGTIRSGKGWKTEHVKAAIERKLGPFAISDIESACPGVSRDMIRLVLRQLRDAGEIHPLGKGRGAKWIKRA